MLKTRNFIVLILILAGLIVWYFFAPIKWTFGLREPRNYYECLDIGGIRFETQEINKLEIPNPYCNYKGKKYFQIEQELQ